MTVFELTFLRRLVVLSVSLSFLGLVVFGLMTRLHDLSSVGVGICTSFAISALLREWNSYRFERWMRSQLSNSTQQKRVVRFLPDPLDADDEDAFRPPVGKDGRRPLGHRLYEGDGEDDTAA